MFKSYYHYVTSDDKQSPNTLCPTVELRDRHATHGTSARRSLYLTQDRMAFRLRPPSSIWNTTIQHTDTLHYKHYYNNAHCDGAREDQSTSIWVCIKFGNYLFYLLMVYWIMLLLFR